MSCVPCASCAKPLQSDDNIIYWRDTDHVKDFIHRECEEAWVVFLQLSGWPIDDMATRHAPTHYSWRNDQQEAWHAALRTYETELKWKGLLINDQKETEALGTEDTCSQ